MDGVLIEELVVHHDLWMVEEHPAEPIATCATEAEQKEASRLPTPEKQQPPIVSAQPLPQ